MSDQLPEAHGELLDALSDLRALVKLTGGLLEDQTEVEDVEIVDAVRPGRGIVECDLTTLGPVGTVIAVTATCTNRVRTTTTASTAETCERASWKIGRSS